VTKFGYLVVFCIVCLIHILVLRTRIENVAPVVKEKTKVDHITLSRVIVKKPPPVISPPKIIEPVVLPNPKPYVEPKKKIRKPKRKKRVKKHKRIEKVKEVKREKVVSKPPAIIPKRSIAPISKIDTSTIKDRYISEIRRQIREKLYYPKIAKRMHIEGEVDVVFVVYASGRIGDIKVINSSRKVLSNGALKTIKSLSLKPVPKALGVDFLKLEVPIEFKLTKG